MEVRVYRGIRFERRCYQARRSPEAVWEGIRTVEAAYPKKSARQLKGAGKGRALVSN